jgi:hypothetical protein
MRKCKSEFELGNINGPKSEETRGKNIPELRIDISRINHQPKIEYDDFEERPIYIRTNVQSFSNLDRIEIHRKISNRELFTPVDMDVSAKSVISDESSESSLPMEEWNRISQTNTKHSSFADGLNTKPKTFSAMISKVINNLFENPEGRMTNSQRVSIVLVTCFEAYRTIISSFLTVFVPQNCDGYSCTILQNIIPKDDLEIAAISVNTFMGLYFCALFTIERIRENVAKEYLIADKSSPTDKEHLVKMLSEMNAIDLKKILRLNRVYRAFAQILLLLFFVNAGISCVVIQKNYLNNTTVTVFITNTLFMINRIHKALKITSSGEYNVYSAYRSDNLIYNRYRGEWLQDALPGIV